MGSDQIKAILMGSDQINGVQINGVRSHLLITDLTQPLIKSATSFSFCIPFPPMQSVQDKRKVGQAVLCS